MSDVLCLFFMPIFNRLGKRDVILQLQGFLKFFYLLKLYLKFRVNNLFVDFFLEIFHMCDLKIQISFLWKIYFVA